MTVLRNRRLNGKPYLLNLASVVAAFYVSPSGSDSAAGTLSAPFATLAKAQSAMAAGAIKTTYVRAGTYSLTSQLSLGSADAGTTYRAYLAEQPVISPATSLTTLIYANGASNLTFQGLTLSGASNTTNHGALELWSCTGASVIANHFTGNGNDNILLVSTTYSTFSGNQFNGGFCGIEAVNQSDHNTVDSNLADGHTNTNTAGGFFYGHGVNYCVISHNQVQNCGGGGINILNFEGPTGTLVTANVGNTISGNIVRNTCTSTADCGAIYTLGRGELNTQLTISGNLVDGTGLGRGIYLDDEANGVTVSNNIVRGVGSTTANNMGEIHAGKNNTFTNNIFDYSGGTLGFLMQDASWSASTQTSAAGTIGPNTFTKNIFWTSGSSLTPFTDINGSHGFSASGNLFPAGTAQTAPNVDVSPSYGDPLFNAPASGDYTLKSGSAATAISFAPIDQTTMGLHPATAYWYPTPALFSSSSTGSFTPLTDITFTQIQPTNTTLTESTLDAKPVVATFAPVGGIGPYIYACLNTDGTLDNNGAGHGFNTISYRNSIRGLANDATIPYSDMGWICAASDAGRTPNKLLSITDASGTVITKTVTINTSLSTKTIWVSSQNRTLLTNQDPYTVQWQVLAWNGSAFDGAVVSIKSDSTGGKFGINFAGSVGYLGLSLVGQWPIAVGSYTIVLQASGYPDYTLNFAVQADVISNPQIISIAGVTPSVAMPAYTEFASLGVTTGLNSPRVSISDPAIEYDLYTNKFIIKGTPAGPTASVTISELDNNLASSNTASNTKTLSFAVATGVPIAASAMVTSGLTTTFNNDTYLNVLGTIPVPAGMNASNTTWQIVTQTGYTRRGEKNLYGGLPARYQISRASGGGGYLTANAMLSAGLDGTSSATDTLTISVTDGTQVCTSTILVTVSWAPVSRTIYIGTGMASAHGSNGYESYPAFTAANLNSYYGLSAGQSTSSHAGTWDIYINVETDPDHNVYPSTSGINGDRYPLQGPIRIHGVPDSGGNLPRVGGVIANNIPTPNLSQGYIRFGDGDALVELLEVSCIHGGSQGDQRGGIYKDGTSYGNLTARKNVVRDVANGIIAGHIHGQILIDSNEFSHSGTETGGAGPAHGIYLDDASAVTITNNYFRLGNYGHLLKSRGTNQIVSHNRIIAGLGGSNSACVDLPDGGVCEVANNDIEHGPNSEVNNIIQWGLEALSYSPDSPYDTNSLYVHDNRINGLLLAGQHFGGPSNVLKHARFLNRFGEPVQSVRFENNACYIAPNPTNDPTQGQLVITDTTWTTIGPTVSMTGNTTPALPFITSTARPYLSGNMPALGGLEYHFSYNDSYSNFETVWQYGDRDQISVSAAAGQGALLAVLHATNDLDAQGRGTPNPFVNGTVWTINTDPMYYSTANPNPWAATGKYQVVSNSDGSAQLQTGSTARATGVDYIKVRATAPNGTKSDIRYAVVVTA